MLECLASEYGMLPFLQPAQHTIINYSVMLCHLTERFLFCVNQNILITILSLCMLPSGHQLLIKEDIQTRVYRLVCVYVCGHVFIDCWGPNIPTRIGII